MAEEERYFIPLVARIDRAAAEEMLLDHGVFRFEIARYGKIRDLARMKRHSLAEDRMAEEMVRRRMVRI